MAQAKIKVGLSLGNDVAMEIEGGGMLTFSPKEARDLGALLFRKATEAAVAQTNAKRSKRGKTQAKAGS